jgi:hypothetical protein
MSLQYRFLAILLSLGFAVSAAADTTIKQTTNGKGLAISGNATGTTYIKGNKMRGDVVLGDKTQTTIFDLDAQKMYIFDSKKKQADVWDMAAFAQEISKNVDLSSIKASFTPNHQTKQIGGHTATGYDLQVSAESAMDGNQAMMMTVTVEGPVWIVKNAPGAADYDRFYKAAVEKGWIFTDPRAAKAQPGEAKALAEMYRKISESGGVAYETDMQVHLSGNGPMAGILAKMGNASFSANVVSIETGPLSDDLFAPPSDYKLNPKK